MMLMMNTMTMTMITTMVDKVSDVIDLSRCNAVKSVSWQLLLVKLTDLSTNVCSLHLWVWTNSRLRLAATSSAVSPECKCSTYHVELEIWTYYSDISWQLTLAAHLSTNNVQAVYHCLQVSVYTGAAPSYLTEMCVPVAASTGHRCLHLAARGDLMVPRTRMITYGSRSFAVSGPRVWNDLPLTLRSSSTTLGQFQRRLKTTLFCLAYRMWQIAVWVQ